MLSLTELPVSEGESGNIPSWVKERDDLLTTVESLKGLITHMQMKVEENQRLCCCYCYYFGPFIIILFTRVPSVLLQTSGMEDWRAQLLDAVRRVFLSERNVLKSALYRQLDALDTSDAIIHLNQLERRLAEQVSQATSVTSGLEELCRRTQRCVVYHF